MKKFIDFLYIALLAVMPFALASCSDDDENSDEGQSDYLEITLNGKTYKEYIPVFGYVFFEGSQTDSRGRLITLTFVSLDGFSDKYGFKILPGISHYTNKSQLLSASPGNYPHHGDFGNIMQGPLDCENFTLITDLEITNSGEYYELVNGTHNVKSIKDVGDGVQVEGSFTGTYKCESSNRQCEMKGKYRMTLNVLSSNNPLD